MKIAKMAIMLSSTIFLGGIVSAHAVSVFKCTKCQDSQYSSVYPSNCVNTCMSCMSAYPGVPNKYGVLVYRKSLLIIAEIRKQGNSDIVTATRR